MCYICINIDKQCMYTVNFTQIFISPKSKQYIIYKVTLLIHRTSSLSRIYLYMVQLRVRRRDTQLGLSFAWFCSAYITFLIKIYNPMTYPIFLFAFVPTTSTSYSYHAYYITRSLYLSYTHTFIVLLGKNIQKFRV